MCYVSMVMRTCGKVINGCCGDSIMALARRNCSHENADSRSSCEKRSLAGAAASREYSGMRAITQSLRQILAVKKCTVCPKPISPVFISGFVQ